MTTLTVEKYTFVEGYDDGRLYYAPTGESFKTDSEFNSPDFIDECAEHFGPLEDLEDEEMLRVTIPGEDYHYVIHNDHVGPAFMERLEYYRKSRH